MLETTLASKQTDVSLDRMTEHDLLEVVAIEEMSNLSPWGWDAYHTELQSVATSLMLVARVASSTSETGRPIVGFIVARELADEIHINNVAVKPEFRGRGIGRAADENGAGLGPRAARPAGGSGSSGGK